jgi:hypothetical protein
MITDSLQKLKKIKKDIKSAIVRKGGDVSDDFSTYADSITNIPIGELLRMVLLLRVRSRAETHTTLFHLSLRNSDTLRMAWTLKQQTAVNSFRVSL